MSSLVVYHMLNIAALPPEYQATIPLISLKILSSEKAYLMSSTCPIPTTLPKFTCINFHILRGVVTPYEKSRPNQCLSEQATRS